MKIAEIVSGLERVFHQQAQRLSSSGISITVDKEDSKEGLWEIANE